MCGRCLDVVTRNINSYVEYLDYLPEYVKFRILVRVTKLKYGIHDDNVMKSLIQPGLRMLNFSSSTITDESLNIISQCKLMNRITFSKANYQMTSEGFISCFSNLQYLQALYISDCEVFVDSVLDCLKDYCCQLAELDIGGCNVTDEGMKSLSLMRELSSLNISRTKVTDTGLKYLTSGPIRKALCELRMCSCPITDVGVNIVANTCPALATLICNDCDIKDMSSSFRVWKTPMKQISWTINFDKPPLF
ncbi:F-box/LRR-repeat protein 16-like [Ctenocephalides felis]|uniref:F-box/LRR-repeat protein 16-like n=1 Tax=Ctenocephalides felis TaxID=7515 RepID=UPI000E6E45DE|nr:F-box/LRR-repeat protein 16-like [Ctenocephalides felis]